MKDCYTACDRQLIKELLVQLKGIISKFVTDSTDVGFYLTVMERLIGGANVLCDQYDLLDSSLAKDHEISMFSLD